VSSRCPIEPPVHLVLCSQNSSMASRCDLSGAKCPKCLICLACCREHVEWQARKQTGIGPVTNRVDGDYCSRWPCGHTRPCASWQSGGATCSPSPPVMALFLLQGPCKALMACWGAKSSILAQGNVLQARADTAYSTEWDMQEQATLDAALARYPADRHPPLERYVRAAASLPKK
jgi:hypothetical protein